MTDGYCVLCKRPKEIGQQSYCRSCAKRLRSKSGNAREQVRDDIRRSVAGVHGRMREPDKEF